LRTIIVGGHNIVVRVLYVTVAMAAEFAVKSFVQQLR
jgi:hypothetical protein